MQIWLQAIDDRPEIVGHGTVVIVAVVALVPLTAGGVPERLAAGDILIEDAGSVLMHLYLTDPWTIAASVAYSAVVLIANAAQSWRWPQPLADRYDSPAMPVAATHSGAMDRHDNLS